MMIRSSTAASVIAILGAALTGAAAATVIVPQGDDTTDGPQALQPNGGPVFVSKPVADLYKGMPWAVRVYTSNTGLTCPEAGRLSSDGRFGRVDDGEFVPLSVQAAGSCAPIDSGNPFSLSVNHYRPGQKQSVAVVFGTTSSDITSVTLVSPSGERQQAVDPRAFLFVSDPAAIPESKVAFDLSEGQRTVSLAPPPPGPLP